MQKVNIGIIGGAGYTGGELLRVLLRHPNAAITFVHSTSNAGELVSKVHADLLGDTELKFASDLDQNMDVLFLCVGHGDAKKFLADHPINSNIKIIDLSQDFRLTKDAVIGNRSFVYGLPELQRASIQSAHNIANPGCFATAIQLGLLPLAAKNILTDVYTTGITGSTGAGQGLSSTSHFSWRVNNIQAYKTLEHQHVHEIEQNLAQLLQYIKKLKPAYQEVIQMRYFQEMSYQDMAEQLNEPLNNIKIKLLRAKKLLAEIISEK
jgi:N-acetyl-gamma-glutamyl-phosphate reductase